MYYVALLELMNATERSLLAEIEDPRISVVTLRLWLDVEQAMIAKADESMRKAQSVKANSTRRARRIKSALKRRGENV